MKAIIFGANGQDGYYLDALLKSNFIDVIKISRSSGDYRGDVSDFKFVKDVLINIRPDFIFHLAAKSDTSHEFLWENNDSIYTGTINLLELVREYLPKTKLFITGSAVQFNLNNLPIDEKTEFAANSPYAVSRIGSVYASRYYRQKYNLEVYVGYLFHHDSILRSDNHLVKIIKSKINNAIISNDKKIVLNDLTFQKEWNHAKDFVQAIWILINQDEIFETVIGCGKAVPIIEYVNRCIEYSGFEFDFELIGKKNTDNIIVSNPGLIKSLGYTPVYDYKMLAKEIMTYTN